MDWFEELANKIAKNDPAYRVDNAKKVHWKWDDKTKSALNETALLNYCDENIEGIDSPATAAHRDSCHASHVLHNVIYAHTSFGEFKFSRNSGDRKIISWSAIG